MAILWLLAGMLIGMAVAWVAEYALDWRHRPLDGNVETDAVRAMQTALNNGQNEIESLRAELARTRQQLVEAQRAIGATPTKAPPL